MPEKKSAQAAKTKAPAKKTASKKTTATKTSVTQSLEERVSVLESRLDALEEHDIARKAEGVYDDVVERVKESYAANPTMAIALALAVLLLILLFIG